MSACKHNLNLGPAQLFSTAETTLPNARLKLFPNFSPDRGYANMVAKKNWTKLI